MELNQYLTNPKTIQGLYIDRSKLENGVRTTVVSKGIKILLNIPNSCSIFATESLAISHALDMIK